MENYPNSLWVTLEKPTQTISCYENPKEGHFTSITCHLREWRFSPTHASRGDVNKLRIHYDWLCMNCCVCSTYLKLEETDGPVHDLLGLGLSHHPRRSCEGGILLTCGKPWRPEMENNERLHYFYDPSTEIWKNTYHVSMAILGNASMGLGDESRCFAAGRMGHCRGMYG